VKEGTSAYDGACWQIALAIEGSPGALGLADNLTKVLWQGRLGLLQDLRAYYDPSNVAEHPFIYNDPQGRDISKYEEGKRGYFFRIFNGNGIWQTKDPLNGKAHLFGYPGPGYDPSLIVWCDWRPITGENMWGGIIGPLQVAYKKYKSQIPEGAIELRLAKEIARAGMLLQTEIGGIRFAPKGTWSEQGTEWPYNEISTENNTSAYAGYRGLYKVAKDEIYKKTMQGIKNYMRNYAFDKKNNIFHQGMHFDGKKWIPNDEHFAVDCQTWPIIVFGPEEIDSWHDEGTAYKIWKNTKERAGYFGQKGNVLGLGYTDGHDVMSIEWTSGGVFACRELASYYKNSHLDWAKECAKDAQTMRQGIDLFKVKVSDNQVAYPYASKRVYIPFGWWSPPTDVLNTCSTSWVIFLDIGFNPFVLGGGDKDLKPKEIKKEEKTQEINSQESQEVVNPSVGRKLIYVDEDNLIFILPSGDIQTLKAEGKLLSKKGGEHFWLWGWLVSWIKGWDDVQVRSLEGEIYWVDKDDLLELGKRNNGSTLTNKSSPEQSLWVQVVSKIISPFEENAFCETKESRDQRAVSTSVPEINWLLNNTFDDGMPHSFQVPEEYTTKGGENYTAQEIWESMGPADSVGAVMERILTRWGLNIYDGACWQTALAATGNKELAEKGRVSTNTLLHGRWGELRDLRAYYVANDPEHPFKYRGTIVPKENCYFFRIISPYYYQSDPLDGKTYLAGFPNNPRIHHEDWKPIDGENAFGPIIGPLQIEYLIYDGKIPLDAPGVILALSVIPAKKAMQNEIGAIHHAPEGTYGKDPDDVSNENNFSDYRAFKMLCEVTAREDINEMMQKQIGYFRDYAFDKEENYFYQGGFYRDGQFIPTKTFAVDCQTWGILSLTPQLIDQLYGEGSAYKIWKTTKERAGYYIDEVLRGLGYTDGHDVCSVEWSCGGIFACRELANYYQDSHPDWAAECANDALTMREGIGAFKVTFDNGEESYLYANKRYYIPFGWWANPIPSTVSTAWVYLVDKGFNPFILGGGVSAIVNEAPVITRMEVTPKKGKLPLEVSFIAEAADADGTIVKYLWNFGDGMSLEGESVTHTYTTAGTYTVTLTVTDNDDKSASITKSVEAVINEAPVDDSVIANFFTYPNPVKGAGNMMKIRYELSREADEVLIKIYDIAGELVKEIHPSQRSQGVNTVEWNMENNGGRRIASGIYIVMIRVKAEGKEEIKKFKVAFIAQVEQEEKNRFAAIKQNKNEVDRGPAVSQQTQTAARYDGDSRYSHPEIASEKSPNKPFLTEVFSWFNVGLAYGAETEIKEAGTSGGKRVYFGDIQAGLLKRDFKDGSEQEKYESIYHQGIAQGWLKEEVRLIEKQQGYIPIYGVKFTIDRSKLEKPSLLEENVARFYEQRMKQSEPLFKINKTEDIEEIIKNIEGLRESLSMRIRIDSMFVGAVYKDVDARLKPEETLLWMGIENRGIINKLLDRIFGENIYYTVKTDIREFIYRVKYQGPLLQESERWKNEGRPYGNVEIKLIKVKKPTGKRPWECEGSSLNRERYNDEADGGFDSNLSVTSRVSGAASNDEGWLVKLIGKGLGLFATNGWTSDVGDNNQEKTNGRVGRTEKGMFDEFGQAVISGEGVLNKISQHISTPRTQFPILRQPRIPLNPWAFQSSFDIRTPNIPESMMLASKNNRIVKGYFPNRSEANAAATETRKYSPSRLHTNSRRFSDQKGLSTTQNIPQHREKVKGNSVETIENNFNGRGGILASQLDPAAHYDNNEVVAGPDVAFQHESMAPATLLSDFLPDHPITSQGMFEAEKLADRVGRIGKAVGANDPAKPREGKTAEDV
ncbi:MAG: PKD domain-containing protein, partial [Candidatus Omnitrophica bacterium]|nr:PKD domain-containing protein [Candidatus Omnitrophota bacterium]